MHKTLVKPRFIITSPKSSIKLLSQALTSAFTHFYRQIGSYNDKYRFFVGVNSFWVVQSNKKPVLKTINKLNSRNAAKSMLPKLPHVLHKLIEFCFDGRESNFTLLNYFGAC